MTPTDEPNPLARFIRNPNEFRPPPGYRPRPCGPVSPRHRDQGLHAARTYPAQPPGLLPARAT